MIWLEGEADLRQFDGTLQDFVTEYGPGVYTTMRTLNGSLIEAEAHAARLGIGLSRLLAGIRKLYEQGEGEVAFVALFSTRLSVWKLPLTPTLNPCKVQLVEHRGRDHPEIKSSDWVGLRASMQAAKPEDCVEVIMMWQDELGEGLMSNVVVFHRSGQIQTAPSARVLAGTTLRRLKEVCQIAEVAPKWSERHEWEAMLVMNQPWLILKVAEIHFDSAFKLPPTPRRVSEAIDDALQLIAKHAIPL